MMLKNVISHNTNDITCKVNAYVHTNWLANAQLISNVNVTTCHSITRCMLMSGCNHERFSKYVFDAACIPRATCTSHVGCVGVPGCSGSSVKSSWMQ